jgi:hypothetical protein
MHPRFLLRKNQILGPITASFLFAKQISYNSKQTHLRFSQFLPPSFFSPPTKTGFSRPLFCNLQSVRAMASQSQSASVHDFTVKVSLILGGYGFPLKTLGILLLFLLAFFLQNFIDGSVIFCLVRNGFDSMRVLSRIRYLNGGKLLV